jgi:hypothetical protein
MEDQGRICPHPIGYTLTALATAEKKAALQVDPIVKESGVERSSVVDPDPAFHVNPEPDPGFDRQKLKMKKYSRNFFLLFFIKNCNLLTPRPP